VSDIQLYDVRNERWGMIGVHASTQQDIATSGLPISPTFATCYERLRREQAVTYCPIRAEILKDFLVYVRQKGSAVGPAPYISTCKPIECWDEYIESLHEEQRIFFRTEHGMDAYRNYSRKWREFMVRNPDVENECREIEAQRERARVAAAQWAIDEANRPIRERERMEKEERQKSAEHERRRIADATKSAEKEARSRERDRINEQRHEWAVKNDPWLNRHPCYGDG